MLIFGFNNLSYYFLIISIIILLIYIELIQNYFLILKIKFYYKKSIIYYFFNGTMFFRVYNIRLIKILIFLNKYLFNKSLFLNYRKLLPKYISFPSQDIIFNLILKYKIYNFYL